MSTPSGPVIGWPNFADRTVTAVPAFSGGSWHATLPLTNLSDRRLARVARSVNALASSTTFDLDLTVVRPVGVVALAAHTLSTGATVQWRASNTAGVFSAPLYDSGAIAAWPAGATLEDVDGLNVSHVHVLSGSITARHWRCTIVDTANPQGFVSVSRLVIAKAWRPSSGMAVGASLSITTETERTVSDGGAALYNPRPMRRQWDFTVPMMDTAESMSSAFKTLRQAGRHGQLLFVFNESDPFMHERAFLCVMRELTPIEYPYSLYQSVAFRLVEEL